MSFELRTKRLILRPMQQEDAQGMFALNQVPDVFQNTGDAPFNDIEEVNNLIRNYTQFEKYRMGRFSLIEIGSNEYVGWCGLKYQEENKEIDLGYRILPEFRNKGLAIEASEKCLEYGFKNLSLEKIVGRAIKENTASIHILKKLGFKFEKEFPGHGTICEQYIISNIEWKDRLNSENLHPQANTKQAS